MTDIALIWNGHDADLAIENDDLMLDDGLHTPTVISLFSDRRARADDRLPGTNDDRRGWPGDAWPQVPGDQIGSRLWLLSREKELAETLRRAREYAQQGLAWMLEDGIAARVEVDVTVPKRGWLRVSVVLHRSDGSRSNHQYDSLWETL